MTAVPSRRTKTKDSFQMELQREMAKRKSAGFATGFSDDDNGYEDDFDDDDDVDDSDLLKQFSSKAYSMPKKGKSKKWQVPSYLDEDDDDDDDIVLDGSKFIKKSESSKKTATSSEIRSSGLLSKQSLSTSHEKNPLLSLLNDDVKTTPPGEDPLLSLLNNDMRKTKLHTDHSSSAAPLRSTSPSFHEQKHSSPLRKSAEKSVLSKSFSQENKESFQFSERQQIKTENKGKMVDHNPYPVQQSNQHNKENILRTSQVKPEDSPSIIDFLLSESTAPVPAPRKKESDNRRERTRSRSGSSARSEETRSQSRPRTPTNKALESGRKSKSPPRPKTPVKESSFLLGNLPSLSGVSKSKPTSPQASVDVLLHSNRSDGSTRRKSGSMKDVHLSVDAGASQGVMREERTNADDLLALFDQPTTLEAAPQHHVTFITEKTKSPVAEVAEMSAQQSKTGNAKQRSSKQLDDNVIENIATYNQENVFDSDPTQPEKEMSAKDRTTPLKSSSRTKLKFSKKSPRTPPANYQGLGSLSSLKQLHRHKQMDETQTLNSTMDIRNSIYMSWLADREKERRKKAKIAQEEQEKENEKKVKELDDKQEEAILTRNAWMEKKEESPLSPLDNGRLSYLQTQHRMHEEILKKEVEQKRRKARKEREKKLREEEEKWKSEKKCEVVRKKKMEEANQRYRDEQKKKRDEELLQKQKEKDKNDESKKAVDEWMNKRSKQWVSDRKKETKEKRKTHKEENERKKDQSEDARDKYQRWREQKEQQMRENRRKVRDDEDKPPWSPANKIIPRQR